MNEAKNIALVLSGGGSRGSYQIGVWQALIDLGVASQVKSVYGTSVGAINGAAFVQGDIQVALDIWQEMNYSKVFANIPEERPKISNRKLYLDWIRGAVKNRGMDVTPLKEVLYQVIEEKAIRDSSIDYGMVVFELTERKAKYMTKDDIPDGQLTDYIIASSTFPIFQPHRIEDNVFIDGGIYDNRPVKFCRDDDRIDTVIVVDVTMARHIWPKKRMSRNREIYYVRPTRLLGSPMAFKNRRILANMELGYLNGIDQLSMLTNNLS